MAANGSFPSFSLAVRIIVGGIGSASVVWAFFVFPIFWQQSPIEAVARHVISGAVFKGDVVAPIQANFSELEQDKWARPAVLSSVAVVDLSALELAISKGDRDNLDRLMKETHEVIRKSLVSSPADPFLWTVLFWLENTRGGFKRLNLQYLNMSYVLGPNEGWVAVKRNRFALVLYPSLPKDMEEDTVREFSRLVGSGYFSVAGDHLVGPGWRVRGVLLSSLRNVDEDIRLAFSKYIYKRGYDLAVPGVVRPEWRPWH